jgi:hypothetical protein
MHWPEVISNDAFNIVEIELKRPGTGKTITSNLDPVKRDPSITSWSSKTVKFACCA